MKNYFTYDELKCPCCGKDNMDEEFMSLLNQAREDADIPFILTSAYRCKKYNREIGAKKTSSHVKGLAVDIDCDNSRDRYTMLYSLIEYFDRIGMGADFLHVDNDTSKDQEVVWDYYE